MRVPAAVHAGAGERVAAALAAAAGAAAATAVMAWDTTASCEGSEGSEPRILGAIEKALASTVRIESYVVGAVRQGTAEAYFPKHTKYGSGSGFVYDAERGLIMTNAHVIAANSNAKRPTVFKVVFASGEVREATVVGADFECDVALIQVEPPRWDAGKKDMKLLPLEFGEPPPPTRARSSGTSALPGPCVCLPRAFADRRSVSPRAWAPGPRAAAPQRSAHSTSASSAGSSLELRRGQTVAAIGAPLGASLGASVGTVEGLAYLADEVPPMREGQTRLTLPLMHAQLVRLAVPVVQGNSGGPVVDERGRVVGITSSALMTRTDPVSRKPLAIAMETADAIGKALMEHRLARPYLGIGVTVIDEVDTTWAMDEEQGGGRDRPWLRAASGLLVRDVVNGTPAHRAGLRDGDVIQACNGRRARLKGDLLAELGPIATPGTVMTLDVARWEGDERSDLTIRVPVGSYSVGPDTRSAIVPAHNPMV